MYRPYLVGVLYLLSTLSGIRAASGIPEKGKQVFDVCSSCHSVEEEKKAGPSLKGLFQRKMMANGQPPTEQSVRKKIEDGGNGMPAFKEVLTDAEMTDLVAYLKTV